MGYAELECERAAGLTEGQRFKPHQKIDNVSALSALADAPPVLAVGEDVERHRFVQTEWTYGHPATSGLCQADTLGYH
jgi:hypothetical protein